MDLTYKQWLAKLPVLVEPTPYAVFNTDERIQVSIPPSQRFDALMLVKHGRYGFLPVLMCDTYAYAVIGTVQANAIVPQPEDHAYMIGLFGQLVLVVASLQTLKDLPYVEPSELSVLSRAIIAGESLTNILRKDV